MKHFRETGIKAFQKVLELNRPVANSYEIWFKLGHNKIIRGNYTPDGHFQAHHTKGNGNSRVCTALIPDAWGYLADWSRNNDGGVFFIPTQPQGYPLKSAIAVSDDVAAELDDGTPQEQWHKISEFSQISELKPAYIVHSGGKSYHPHWKVTEHLPIAQTMYLRRLLCIALAADPVIGSNPAQPMRLPGFYRKEKGREQTLEYWSECRYTYDDFSAGFRAYFAAKDIPFPVTLSDERWRIYKRDRRNGKLDFSILTKPEDELYPKPKNTVTTPVNTSYIGKIPLELALSKANQEALKGVGSDRNNIGLAIACDLIGCNNWLVSNGYSVDGDSYHLFINYCRACASGGGWNPREWESIWRSASRGNPSPSRRDLSSFVHWYRWKNDSEYKQAATAEWKKNNPLPVAKEPDSITYQEYVAWEKERDEIEEAQERSEFVDWLTAKAKRIGNKLAKNFHKGFGQYCIKHNQQNVDVELPQIIKYHPESPLPTPEDYKGKEPPKIKFNKGQRIKVVNKLRSLGWQFVLDDSFMGLGKSHEMGQYANAEGKAWYVDLNHRNPTTATVEQNFKDLPVRHDGLNQDPSRSTPLGNPHLKWAAKDDPNPDLPSLCHNAHKFIELQNKGYSLDEIKDEGDESSLNPICKNCKYNRWKVEGDNGEKIAICAAQIGEGYGFRHARKQGLSYPKIRASIDSLPSVGDYDYSNDIAVVDEASQVIRGTRTVKANAKDFALKMSELEQYPLLFNALKQLRDNLLPLLSGRQKLPYEGLNHSQLVEILNTPPPEILEIIDVIAEINPCWSDLAVEPERVKGWGKNWRDSMSSANWYLRQEAIAMTKENIDNLASNFLPLLLCVWARVTPGTVRIDSRRQLHVTTKDTRHGETLREMQMVILLDATANKQLLAKRIGVNPNSIIEIEQELPPLDNLTVVNVQMEGMSSSQWSVSCLARLQAFSKSLRTQHPDISILGLKKHAGTLKLDGWWFNDNRGSNAFKGKSAIATFGKPQINLGVAQDEYLTLYGSLDGFDEFYQGLVDAEVTQLIGRQRAHLHPNTQFLVHLVGTNLQLDHLRSLGINAVNRHAAELCPEAGTPKQISKYKLLKAIGVMLSHSNKITAKRIAKVAEISIDHTKNLVSDFGGLKALKKWVLHLYESNRSSTHFFRSEDLLLDVKIRHWMQLEPIAAATEFIENLNNYGWRDFHEYLSLFSIEIQAAIWGAIAPLVLPESILQEFEKALSPPPE